MLLAAAGGPKRPEEALICSRGAGDPVLSVDTKKKELAGAYKNGGREWRPRGEPVDVNTHDFPDAELGKAIPYGVYDLAANTRWVNVGTGDIEAIIGAARAYPLEGTKAGDLDKKLGYFEPNTHRMRYQHFRDLGMFIGSGAIEGGIKAIVVQRAKQSGMHWTTEGAADIIALRCQHASGRWDELWPATNTTPAQLRAAV